MKKYFITYGNAAFAKSRDRLCRQASSLGFFDVVRGFGGKDLSSIPEWKDAQKLDEFAKIVGERTHAFWIWKPAIIYYMLSEVLKANDVLFYSDGGSTIPTWNQGSKPKEISLGYRGLPQYKNGKEFAPHSRQHSLLKFAEYTEMINTSSNSCLSFPIASVVNHKPCLEKYWTKPDVFDHFNVKNDKSITDTLQRAGGMLHVVRKCPFSLELYKEWWMTAKHYPALFTNETSFPDFKIRGNCHRHDQSIWSVLSKMHGTLVSDDWQLCPILQTRYNSKSAIHNTPY
jgi:hypothetical protein